MPRKSLDLARSSVLCTGHCQICTRDGSLNDIQRLSSFLAGCNRACQINNLSPTATMILAWKPATCVQRAGHYNLDPGINYFAMRPPPRTMARHMERASIPTIFNVFYLCPLRQQLVCKGQSVSTSILA